MITVVGSFVVDLMTRAPHLPVPGETVLGGPFTLGPGGKGGNQAVAAARAGAKVEMLTKLGNDEFGEVAKKNFGKEGIGLTYTPISDEFATGAALISVDQQTGENMIVVALGATGEITREEVLAAEECIASSKVVLTQLETSQAAFITTVELTNKHNVPLVFNPAPYQDFPREILKGVAYLTPNETEAGYLTGIDVVDDDSALKAAQCILDMGVKCAIITLGGRGCLVYEGADNYKFIDAFKVDKVVDTTGAGDAFNGGFAHAIAEGMPLYEAARFASAVAALSVTKAGTAVSMPQREEVEAFLATH